jgi:hypothetical protein
MGDKAVLLRVPVAETGPVTERLRVREIDDDEGRRLVRIVRRGSGSVVTWRRAQMVLLSAQGMDVPGIAKVAFTSENRVRDVILAGPGRNAVPPTGRGLGHRAPWAHEGGVRHVAPIGHPRHEQVPSSLTESTGFGRHRQISAIRSARARPWS